MTPTRFFLLAMSSIPLVPLAAAHAAEPVAMVEEATDTSVVVPFDYLSPGQSITLGSDGRVVIDYFASCQRESITGGTITVGTEQSEIKQGKVKRERVACDGGRLVQNQSQSTDSAVMVFRQVPKAKAADQPVKAERRIFALCPIVNMSGFDKIMIERRDRPAAPITIEVARYRLLHGGFYDFAVSGPCPFVAGGTYQLVAGSRSLVFTVDPATRRTKGPLVSRLLAF